jgi:hypothetical protein
MGVSWVEFASIIGDGTLPVKFVVAAPRYIGDKNLTPRRRGAKECRYVCNIFCSLCAFAPLREISFDEI